MAAEQRAGDLSPFAHHLSGDLQRAGNFGVRPIVEMEHQRFNEKCRKRAERPLETLELLERGEEILRRTIGLHGDRRRGPAVSVLDILDRSPMTPVAAMTVHAGVVDQA